MYYVVSNTEIKKNIYNNVYYNIHLILNNVNQSIFLSIIVNNLKTVFLLRLTVKNRMNNHKYNYNNHSI